MDFLQHVLLWHHYRAEKSEVNHFLPELQKTEQGWETQICRQADVRESTDHPCLWYHSSFQIRYLFNICNHPPHRSFLISGAPWPPLSLPMNLSKVSYLVSRGEWMQTQAWCQPKSFTKLTAAEEAGPTLITPWQWKKSVANQIILQPEAMITATFLIWIHILARESQWCSGEIE